MSNFSAFNQEHLRLLLEPFAPGMAEYITPIKYEALSPDSFYFLFRTTDNTGGEHFFVSLEQDYVGDLESAKCNVEEWHGSVIRFWPLQDKPEAAKEDVKDFQAETSGPYFAMLAEVEKPTHKGYWADAVKILPGDKIGEKIKHFTEKEQANIRKTLTSILQHKVDPQASFLDSYQAKKQDTIVDDINTTDIAVSLYVQPDGNVECFYNYVHPTIGGKEYQPKQ